ncbi:hypothetical protein EDEG_03709 [Edhazardia aedis USNM 41457]|uniref:Uncharacterized protein n=1 Tax=Edhazardia aedis (strain USNM 41457) TaxID=1003232 RepID=J9D1S6_EDHAE|nr:hypothetical protein EDEG_03709 [Edhazardia aedis USNM 41457]|eukprot:EJW01801.1 hypothetical protein EDEG_03709 [Edhazardia aedis USNM 41457]
MIFFYIFVFKTSDILNYQLKNPPDNSTVAKIQQDKQFEQVKSQKIEINFENKYIELECCRNTNQQIKETNECLMKLDTLECNKIFTPENCDIAKDISLNQSIQLDSCHINSLSYQQAELPSISPTDSYSTNTILTSSSEKSNNKPFYQNSNLTFNSFEIQNIQNTINGSQNQINEFFHSKNNDFKQRNFQNVPLKRNEHATYNQTVPTNTRKLEFTTLNHINQPETNQFSAKNIYPDTNLELFDKPTSKYDKNISSHPKFSINSTICHNNPPNLESNQQHFLFHQNQQVLNHKNITNMKNFFDSRFLLRPLKTNRFSLFEESDIINDQKLTKSEELFYTQPVNTNNLGSSQIDSSKSIDKVKKISDHDIKTNFDKNFPQIQEQIRKNIKEEESNVRQENKFLSHSVIEKENLIHTVGKLGIPSFQTHNEISFRSEIFRKPSDINICKSVKHHKLFNVQGKQNTFSINIDFKQFYYKKLRDKKCDLAPNNIDFLKMKFDKPYEFNKRWYNNFIYYNEKKVKFANYMQEKLMLDFINWYLETEFIKSDIDIKCNTNHIRNKSCFHMLLRHRLIMLDAKFLLLPEAYQSVSEYMIKKSEFWHSTAYSRSFDFVHEKFKTSTDFLYHISDENKNFIFYSRSDNPNCIIAIHRSARILSCDLYWKHGVIIGEKCEIHQNVYLSKNTTILDGSIVYSNCYIGEGSYIGQNCIIGCNTYIDDYNILISRVKIGINNYFNIKSERNEPKTKFVINQCDFLIKNNVFFTFIQNQNFFSSMCTISPMVVILKKNKFGSGCYVGPWSLIDSSNHFGNEVDICSQFLVANVGKITKYFRILHDKNEYYEALPEIFKRKYSYKISTINFLDESTLNRLYNQTTFFLEFIKHEIVTQ